jgi:hypothetical protein
MGSQLRLGVFTMCCLGFALPATAQLDSYALHAKFGPPLNRETFHIPAGFDLVVDYGPSNQVCKLEVPALMPIDEKVEKVENSAVMKQRMYDFLGELVSASMRGKELRRGAVQMGLASMSFIEYENITISEPQDGNQPFSKDHTITVTFKSYDCQRPSGP